MFWVSICLDTTTINAAICCLVEHKIHHVKHGVSPGEPISGCGSWHGETPFRPEKLAKLKLDLEIVSGGLAASNI